MERITTYIRTIKKAGDIRVRFRLIDGRAVQLFYTSDIVASLEDLSRFTPSGQVRDRISIFNEGLYDDLNRNIDAIKSAYRRMKSGGIELTDEEFKKEVNKELHPDNIIRTADTSIVNRYRRFVKEQYNDGVFGDSRLTKYTILGDKLQRFLTIKGRLSITPQEFDAEILKEFRQYLFDEYLYVDGWRQMYTGVSEQNLPTARMSANTVATNLKLLSAFFTDIEGRVIDGKCEIVASPFRMLGKAVKKVYLHEDYDAPVFLTADEFQKVLSAEVPDTLKSTKEAFLVQCALGCRIGDFKSLTMDNVTVSDEGIPYVHYLPHKTSAETGNVEVETPIVRFAFDIIKSNGFKFPVLTYVTGQNGYNTKIKRLIEHCGINRKVAVSVKEARTKTNSYIELSEVASSKLCRKTHVDMLTKVQVNKYASGLHKQGSKAVDHYTVLGLKERFTLLCRAFDQKEYTADQSLNVIDKKFHKK